MDTGQWSDTGTMSRPPVVPAIVGWLALVISIVIQVSYPTTDNAGWHWAGWAVGALGTVACLGYHRIRDRYLQQRPDYVWNRGRGLAVTLAAIGGTIVGLVHAYRVAQWYFG